MTVLTTIEIHWYTCVCQTVCDGGFQKRSEYEPMVNLIVFVGDKADFSSKWSHLGIRIKRITVWKGLKAFCDNKLNITRDCWNITFHVYAHKHTHIDTQRERETCKASGVICTSAASSQRNKLVSFQRTDGCQEYAFPQNQWRYLNSSH